jgi:DnaJ-class molecular chaperone
LARPRPRPTPAGLADQSAAVRGGCRPSEDQMFRRDFLAGLFAGISSVIVGCSKATPPPAADGGAAPPGEPPKPKNPFRNDSPSGDSTAPEPETVEQPCAGCTGTGKVTGVCDTCKNLGTCEKCSGVGTQPCRSCGGRGQLPERRPPNNNCSHCNGRGEVECTKCSGKRSCRSCGGKEVKETCPGCRGKGTVRVPKT